MPGKRVQSICSVGQYARLPGPTYCTSMADQSISRRRCGRVRARLRYDRLPPRCSVETRERPGSIGRPPILGRRNACPASGAAPDHVVGRHQGFPSAPGTREKSQRYSVQVVERRHDRNATLHGMWCVDDANRQKDNSVSDLSMRKLRRGDCSAAGRPAGSGGSAELFRLCPQPADSRHRLSEQTPQPLPVDGKKRASATP